MWDFNKLIDKIGVQIEESNYGQALILLLSLETNIDIWLKKLSDSKKTSKSKNINNKIEELKKQKTQILKTRIKIKNLQKKYFFLDIFNDVSMKSEEILDFKKLQYLTLYLNYLEKKNEGKKWFILLKELELLNKTAINIKEEEIKKLYSLESSNIIEVQKKAKKDIETLRKEIKKLEKLSVIFIKNIKVLEKNKENNLIKVKEAETEKELLKVLVLYKNKQYIDAINETKKILSNNPYHKKTNYILKKIQKDFEKQAQKEDLEKNNKDEVSNILKEAWVLDLSKSKNTEVTTFGIDNVFSYIKKTLFRKNEQKKNLENLKAIEKILLNSWDINKVKKWSINSNYSHILKEWFLKDISNFNINWFNFYWKILSKDEFTWDAFWYYKNEKEWKIFFYLWDATWHWVQASFTVAIVSKLFYEATQKYTKIEDIFIFINNELKLKIKWRYFMTGILFERDENNKTLKYIWGWHDPLFIYNKNSHSLEKLIPWWLAIWVRIINNVNSIKTKEIDLLDWDVLIWFTDGLIEARNLKSEIFWMKRLEELLNKTVIKNKNITEIYNGIIHGLTEFTEWNSLDDDMSIVIFQRDTNTDILNSKEEIDSLIEKEKIEDPNIKIKKWKNKQQILEEIKKQKYESNLKIRLDRLKQLYELREYFKLKQEIIKYLKEWYNHPKIKFYLEKSVFNEQKWRIEKDKENLKIKYKTLLDLYKRWDYENVIKNCIEILTKENNTETEKFLKLLNKTRGKALNGNKNKGNLEAKNKKYEFVFFWVNKKQVRQFINKLSSFISSWIDIRTSVALIQKQTKNKKLKSIIWLIKTNLDYWLSLSDTIKQYSKYFDPLIVSLLEVWERTWNLPVVLKELDKKLLEDIELKWKIKWAMIYPSVLIFMTIGMVVLMMVLVIPKVTTNFIKAWVELPLLTKIVIWTSDTLKNHFKEILFTAFVSIFSIWLFKNTYPWKLVFWKIALKIPVFWYINKQANIIMFINSLALLLDSWVLILDALDTCSTIVPNLYYKRDIIRIKNEVESWVTLSQAMWLTMNNKELFFSNPYFSEELVQMVTVWEETWTLSKTVDRIWKNYSLELKNYISNIAVMIEPFILIIVWSIVWTIVIAIMLPIFNMWKVIEQQ